MQAFVCESIYNPVLMATHCLFCSSVQYGQGLLNDANAFVSGHYNLHAELFKGRCFIAFFVGMPTPHRRTQMNRTKTHPMSTHTHTYHLPESKRFTRFILHPVPKEAYPIKCCHSRIPKIHQSKNPG